jgi:hypothetical protein
MAATPLKVSKAAFVREDANKAAKELQKIRHSVPIVNLNKTSADQSTVVNAVLVIVALGFLNTWIVEKKSLPERKFFFQMAILGFILAGITEVNSKVGKLFAYLILTGAVFDRSEKILSELTKVESKSVTPPSAKVKTVTPDDVTIFVTGGVAQAQQQNPASGPKPNFPRPHKATSLNGRGFDRGTAAYLHRAN